MSHKKLIFVNKFWKLDYTLYSAEDFAADEFFINYHLKNDDKAVAFWEDWKIHHPEKLDEIYNAERLLDLMTFALSDEEIAVEHDRLANFLAIDRPNKPLISSKKSAGKRNFFLACLAFLLFACAGFWFSAKPVKKLTEVITKTNPFAQRSIIVLGDGTKVTLNANSTISFPKEFAKDKRVVNLNGEAFFEVTKNKHRPFLVKTGSLTTKVLGTKFNVNTHLQNSAIQIALLEGKVSLSTDDKAGEILLKPLETVVFEAQEGRFSKSAFSSRELTAWKDGMLIFKNASFDDVAKKIYNFYGINLINNNKSNKWSYTGEFYNRDYLTVIKSICYTKHLKYRQTKDTITIN
ncbi:MAG TPA: FecR domain-containing protein [Pelobium sp.]